jgi:hypothetical protein
MPANINNPNPDTYGISAIAGSIRHRAPGQKAKLAVLQAQGSCDMNLVLKMKVSTRRSIGGAMLVLSILIGAGLQLSGTRIIGPISSLTDTTQDGSGSYTAISFRITLKAVILFGFGLAGLLILLLPPRQKKPPKLPAELRI